MVATRERLSGDAALVALFGGTAPAPGWPHRLWQTRPVCARRPARTEAKRRPGREDAYVIALMDPFSESGLRED